MRHRPDCSRGSANSRGCAIARASNFASVLWAALARFASLRTAPSSFSCVATSYTHPSVGQAALGRNLRGSPSRGATDGRYRLSGRLPRAIRHLPWHLLGSWGVFRCQPTPTATTTRCLYRVLYPTTANEKRKKVHSRRCAALGRSHPVQPFDPSPRGGHCPISANQSLRHESRRG